MPYRPVGNTFRDESGEDIIVYETRVDEPVSGETLGTVLTTAYTPRKSYERLVVAQQSGPTGRCRVDVRVDGGAWVNGATGVVLGPAGTEQDIEFRPVGLPFVGDDTEESAMGVAVVGEAVEAGWLD